MKAKTSIFLASFPRIAEWIVGFAAAMASPIAVAADAVISGCATAHDGTSIYYEVRGSGKRNILFGRYVHPGNEDLKAYVDGLGDKYRLIVADYPGGARDAKMYTLTPDAMARDYIAVLNAAGADEFAYYGYSFGAVSGLQLAIRTDRMKALVAGGFPMINGPYPDILGVLRAAVFDNVRPSGESPEVSRQFLTYFEGLQSFDDRKVQGVLRMPRLNFVGADDHMVFPGGRKVDFYAVFAANEKALQAAGWQTMSLAGEDHATSMLAEVVVPLLRKWLDENWSE